ncbi:MAG: hypothetical protein E7576_12335 [Ruminococcaceae bacterium]|jgi:hypothetical protein|nr:hypothetical protein [Oscillospiraceae bacterium]
MKKKLSLSLAVLLLASCANNSTQDPEAAASDPTSPTEEIQQAEETEPEEPAVPAPDLPEGLGFEGAAFTFGVVDNPNAKNSIIVEEMTGEVLNDAQYTTVQSVNEALNVEIGEFVMTSGYPAANAIMPQITAGDDMIQVANVFCVDAPTLMGKGFALNYAEIPYIDLDKPYWDAGINDSLSLGGVRYAAIGDLSISTHDLTYILLFSQSLITQNNLDSPYALVFEGKWTMDAMNTMMESSMMDANGNGERDNEDVFGYLAANKMVLPSFWIGAGEKSMEIDENGVPVLAMNDERFVSVIEKIFAMTYDNNARFKTSEDSDVPTACRDMFATGHSVFLDCSLFWVSALRDMETDFGIIPYPKFDENQQDYCARVSYYMPPMIPITNQRLELTGAVLEEANYFAKLNITPAYYEISLKGKYSRDPESISMLDLIFASRVVDLGDTLFCSNVRDGFVATMYSSDNRDIASNVAKNEKIINKTVQKMIEGISG